MRLAAGALAAAMWLTPAWALNTRTESAPDGFDTSLLRIDEANHLGLTVPDIRVQTETGKSSLVELAGGEPVILLLAYYTCHGTCPVTMQNLANSLGSVDPSGHRVIVLSFDATDTIESLKMAKSEIKGLPANWTFGLMTPDDVKRITEAIGYRYFFSEKDQVYVHPSVLLFLSPEGRITRYLYGATPRPKDVDLALLEAGKGVKHVNDLVNMALLICSHYDPSRSRYGMHPLLIFGSAGLGLLGLTGLVTFTFKRDVKGVHS